MNTIVETAEKDGKKVKLNKPFRVSDGKSKFAVYVKNAKGNVIKVRFGDPNMEIKRDDPERRKSFRARHNCDTANDKTTARFWSCRMWQAGTSVGQMTEDEILEEHEVFVEADEIEEEISKSERIKRGRNMKRKSKIIDRKRKRTMKRAPDSDAIERRARKRAISAMKKKLSRGKDLSPSQRAQVEKKVKQRSAMVDRMAKKLKPQVRKDARERMKTKREMKEALESKMTSHLQENMTSYINESVESKIKSLYKQLVAAENAGKDTKKLESQIDSLADKAGLSTKELAALVESVNEDDAFIQAADEARDAGKSHFMFNGKKFPVTIKQDIEEAEELTEARYGSADYYSSKADRRREHEWEAEMERRYQAKKEIEDYSDYHIYIDGKLWKKAGKPVVFRGKARAMKSGQTVKNRNPEKKVQVRIAR